jgi:hypothetical protein
MRILIGCDPELFVTQDGKARSAWGMIPGTKEKPHIVENGAVQVDGMALEFNTDPVDNANDFVRNVTSVMGQMRQMIPADHEFAIVPSVRFNGNHFRAQPDEAKELGCTPDFNAYTMKENPKPDNTTTMRTASGHVHIGFCEGADPSSEEHMIRCATLVKQLDCYLGLPSLMFDTDTKRRAMYGAAGAFRPKSYGVEYRVLSNAWLLSEERMRFVFDTTVLAVTDLVAGKRMAEKIGDNAVVQAINMSDKYSAHVYLRNQLGSDFVNKANALALARPVKVSKESKKEPFDIAYGVAAA